MASHIKMEVKGDEAAAEELGHDIRLNKPKIYLSSEISLRTDLR